MCARISLILLHSHPIQPRSRCFTPYRDPILLSPIPKRPTATGHGTTHAHARARNSLLAGHAQRGKWRHAAPASIGCTHRPLAALARTCPRCTPPLLLLVCWCRCLSIRRNRRLRLSTSRHALRRSVSQSRRCVAGPLLRRPSVAEQHGRQRAGVRVQREDGHRPSGTRWPAAAFPSTHRSQRLALQLLVAADIRARRLVHSEEHGDTPRGGI